MPDSHTYKDLARAVVPKLVEGLTTPLTEKEKTGETVPREERPRIAFTGTYEECLDSLNDKFITIGTGAPQARYTTGAAVVLPTPELVAKMLTGTSHSPDEVIGTMRPGALEFTVEKVAINAVMAGCKPEHLPVVLALSKVMATEGRVIGMGGGATTLPVVSGPITKEIGMDYINCAGIGNPANNSIGQAVSLMLINLGGFISGGGAASPLATPPPIAFAEQFDSPWTLIGEDVGFKRDQSVVCLIGGTRSAGSYAFPPAYRCDGEKKLLEWLARAVAAGGSAAPTIIMNPSIARDLAIHTGMTKEDVKQYLYDNCSMTKEQWVQQLRRPRPVPEEIAALPDDTKIRVIGSSLGYRADVKGYEVTKNTADNICIVVAGGEEQSGTIAARAQSPYRNWIESVDAWR